MISNTQILLPQIFRIWQIYISRAELSFMRMADQHKNNHGIFININILKQTEGILLAKNVTQKDVVTINLHKGRYLPTVDNPLFVESDKTTIFLNVDFGTAGNFISHRPHCKELLSFHDSS